ncbi:MAG: hypothetical protein CR977_00235 [Gammaproteobacteria bacterium]|nr:MAG: hypothetical protein CR977_00235 [Gammaproteobacteria bacterium]
MRYFTAFRYLLLSLFLVATSGQAKSHIITISTSEAQQTLLVNVKSRIELPEEVREAIFNGITLVFSYQFDENPITFERETFNHLSSAVAFMQQLNNFPLILTSQLPKTPLTLAVRFHLTAENLPSYVRVERLFSDAWEADSEWSNWPIQHHKQ